MITTLTVVVAVLALINLVVAYFTYLSQTRSEKLFGEMTGILIQMNTLQTSMDARERHLRQERARTAVQTLVRALRRQVSLLDGQWQSLSLKIDPLEPLRILETELAWIPECEWKTECKEILRAVGPLPGGLGAGIRMGQWSTLRNGCSKLEPAGQWQLYEDCLKAIDEMG